jgi:hypothetical protein
LKIVYLNTKLNILLGGNHMDIAALSMAMSQSRVQESAGIAVMKMAMDTGKDNTTQTTEMMNNIAVDPNIGQLFNAIA